MRACYGLREEPPQPRLGHWVTLAVGSYINRQLTWFNVLARVEVVLPRASWNSQRVKKWPADWIGHSCIIKYTGNTVLLLFSRNRKYSFIGKLIFSDDYDIFWWIHCFILHGFQLNPYIFMMLILIIAFTGWCWVQSRSRPAWKCSSYFASQIIRQRCLCLRWIHSGWRNYCTDISNHWSWK